MSIDIVAVDFEPITWAVRCDICDQIVTEPTTDETLVDSQEVEHRQLHGLADVD
jgi:ribosomal protein S27E